MTPKQLLSTSWNKIGFMYEFIAVFTLIFFVSLWIFIAKLNNKQNNKIYMTFGFTFATFLMFVIPWSWSFFLSSRRSFALANPIVVLLQAILQGIDVTKKTFTPIFKGSGYLMFGEILGGLVGYIAFIPIFYLLKFFFKDNENTKHINLINIFKIENKANNHPGYFAVKETIFISLFTACVPLLNYINQTSYGATHWDKTLITLAVVGFSIYLSSYFGYYSFHIYFWIMNLLLSLINLAISYIKKSNIKTNKVLVYQNLWSATIASTLTFIIPILFGLIIVGITKHSGAGLNF
ncbi:hypothetical protein EG856_00055 [Mycoplasmopsis phocirhinis]|uniref:Uncharacterized protein n=1 Tax=Mycoplasmopsis phocirhinis TaxID=142650 RepID=A0A4P6MRR2_9BACT|nr:hypothetical protein [Mycoplasmopsis phocirhinis]QBF34334.1 hypothetical protein EG856_00055 [Mycoplasmopsis phocirhinis]